mmetsp:Transcript_2368/g.7865  ORF Transcript_2368/g.7865 Transcript_2368/m.7865 type:complete len:305 (+) Transcript_2368:7017-7931(+)
MPERLHHLHRLAVDDALADKVDAPVQVVGEESTQDVALGLVLARVQPLPQERLPADVLRVDVHHAAARDGGGRRVLQIVHFEEHRARGEIEPDALAVGQCEKLVVVHHRVHVLDPERVDVAVVDNVAPLLLALGHRPVHIAEEIGEQPVGPVTGGGVEHAVELVDVDRLRVNHEELRGQVETVLGARQCVERHRLAAARRADDHGCVPRHKRLVQLDHLVHLDLELLVASIAQCALHRVVEVGVAHAWAVEAGEQIADETPEERHVGVDELGHVHVAQCAHQDGGLVKLGRGALEAARHDQHRL